MSKIKLQIILSMMLALVSFLSCKTDRVGNDRDQVNVILLNLLNRNNDQSPERRLCTEAVLVMNQCVGGGSGFSAQTMCNNANINKGTTENLTSTPPVKAATAVDNYTTLSACVKGKVAEYNCNFTQYKVSTAKSAYDAYFKACDVPTGIINSNTY